MKLEQSRVKNENLDGPPHPNAIHAERTVITGISARKGQARLSSPYGDEAPHAGIFPNKTLHASSLCKTNFLGK